MRLFVFVFGSNNEMLTNTIFTIQLISSSSIDLLICIQQYCICFFNLENLIHLVVGSKALLVLPLT